MKKLIYGAGVLTLSNLAVRAVGYLYTLLMGRLLPVTEFGLLNLALPLQYLVVAVASSGISPSVAKFISACGGGDKKRRSIASSSLLFYSVIGIFAFLFFYLLAEPISVYVFHTARLTELLRISAAALPFGIMVAVFTGVFQGMRRFDYMGITLIVEQLLRVFFAFAFVYFGLKTAGAILGSTAGFAAAAAVAYLFFAALGQRLSRPSVQEFEEIFRFSMPVSLAATSTFALAYIDVVLIGFYLTPRDVGFYSAASPTSRLVLTLSTAIYGVLLPSISELHSMNLREEIKKRVADGYKIFLLISLPVTFFAVAAAGQIISLLFPLEASPEAVNSFRILVSGVLFLGIFTVNSGVFQSIGMPQIPVKLILLAAAFDVVFNMVLIPLHGIEGAAMASSFSFVFAGVSSTVLLKRFI